SRFDQQDGRGSGGFVRMPLARWRHRARLQPCYYFFPKLGVRQKCRGVGGQVIAKTVERNASRLSTRVMTSDAIVIEHRRDDGGKVGREPGRQCCRSLSRFAVSDSQKG